MTRAALSWNINQVVKGIENGTITSDNAIQRGFVWDKKRMSLLIDTVLRDYTIPPIYTIKTEEVIKVKSKEVSVYDLIDGKQRTTTFAKFMNNEFRLEGLETFVQSDGEEVDINGKTFEELDEDMQDTFKSYGLTVYYFSDITDEEISDMMSRLNNGKPLTGTENARIKAKNLPEIQQLASHKLLTDNLSETALRGYANEDIIIKIALLLNEQSELSTKNVRNAYETFTFGENTVSEITNILDFVADAIEAATDDKKVIKRITSKANLITVLYVAKQFMEISKEDYEDKVSIYGDKLSQFFDGDNGATISEDYNEACTNGTMRATNVITRNDELYKFVTED